MPQHTFLVVITFCAISLLLTMIYNDLPFVPEKKVSKVLWDTENQSESVFPSTTLGSIDSVMRWAVVGGCLQAKMEDRKEEKQVHQYWSLSLWRKEGPCLRRSLDLSLS